MKKAILLSTFFALLVCAGYSQARPKAPVSTPQEDSVQYALGVYMMQQLFAKTGFIINNPTLFKKAIDDVIAKKPLMVKAETVEQRLLAYQEVYRLERGRRLEELLFAKMRTQPNYAALPTGVLYTLVKVGAGATPTLRDTVVVNVISTLPDGVVVDDASKTQQSYMAITSDMIPGLRDVIQRMKEGSIARAIVPAAQAYGAKGSPTIPPNSAIIYDIALVSVRQAR